MDNLSVWLEIVILAGQLLLAIGQLRLSRKIHNQDLSLHKGYFLIKETNWSAPKAELTRFRDIFDLREGLPFYVEGDDDIILHRAIIVVDGRSVTPQNIVYDTYYTRNPRFSIFNTGIFLNDTNLKNTSLEVKLSMELENTCGYLYKEEIEMEFDNKGENMWRLSKFNIRFKK